MEAKQHASEQPTNHRRNQKEIKICMEKNVNENMTTQHLWDSVKAVLRGRFIAIQTYLKKQDKNQIDNLTLYLKQLEKLKNGEPQSQQQERNHKNQIINKKKQRILQQKSAKLKPDSLSR